jgi:hypothetical protein
MIDLSNNVLLRMDSCVVASVALVVLDVTHPWSTPKISDIGHFLLTIFFFFVPPFS